MRTLKSQTVRSISYCFDLLGFIFQNPDAGKIIKSIYCMNFPRLPLKSIYLFGSAVRGELEKTSDIDLFVECDAGAEGKAKSLVDSGLAKFMVSKDYQKWKLFQFIYPFSVQIGLLADWDLKLSIVSEGIVLYSRMKIISAEERRVLFIFKYPLKKKEYLKIRRIIFGRDESYYQGTGLLNNYKGEKISSTVFIIPKIYQTNMMDVLSKEKVAFSMKEITVLG